MGSSAALSFSRPQLHTAKTGLVAATTSLQQSSGQLTVAHNKYPWGVTWCGKVPETVNLKINTDEIKKAFLTWSSFSFYDEEIAQQIGAAGIPSPSMVLAAMKN